MDRNTGNECYGHRLYTDISVAGEPGLRMEQYNKRRCLLGSDKQLTDTDCSHAFDDWLQLPCYSNGRLRFTINKQHSRNNSKSQPGNHGTACSTGSSM